MPAIADAVAPVGSSESTSNSRFVRSKSMTCFDCFNSPAFINLFEPALIQFIISIKSLIAAPLVTKALAPADCALSSISL
jgi:hypothetical protein